MQGRPQHFHLFWRLALGRVLPPEEVLQQVVLAVPVLALPLQA